MENVVKCAHLFERGKGRYRAMVEVLIVKNGKVIVNPTKDLTAQDAQEVVAFARTLSMGISERDKASAQDQSGIPKRESLSERLSKIGKE